jgi:iron complex transport system substrate-binding protein
MNLFAGSTGRLLLVALFGLMTLFANSSTVAQGQAAGTPAGAGTASPTTAFPVATEDCFGRELTFSEPPARVVTLDGYALEFLLRLGLGDHIVGTGFPLTPDKIPADLADAMAAVPILGETDLHLNLSTEEIAAARPDLILTAYPFMLDATFDNQLPSDVLGPDVLAVTACNGTPNASHDGIESTYQFIDQLGLIFGVQDRSNELATEMRDRQASLAASIPAGDSPRVMLVGGIPNGDSPVFSWGGASFPNGIVRLAGATNVFGDVNEDFFSPSAEDIAARDPEFLVIIVRDPPPANGEVAATLLADPALGETTAVRESRFIVLSDALMAGPTARNLDGVERIIDALYSPAAS